MAKRLRWAPRWLLGAVINCSLVLSQQLLVGQEAPTPPPASRPDQAQTGENPVNKKDAANHDTNKPQNDRIFYALPNYLTVENASSLPPLTARQKFKLEALSNFDPVEYPYVGVVASINQSSNSEPAFGQGFRGYAKRYGTAFGDSAIENFMVGAVFPSLLREEPRYFQMGKGKIFHRIAYAASRVFITRSDSGHSQFNFSELLGSGVAAGISNAYHPPPRTLGDNISIWWTQIGWDAAGYELKEFWPDLKRKLHR
jgi:hypothetical protein